MTLITLQGGLVVLRGGLVGTEQACCCGGDPCIPGCECLSDGCGNNGFACDGNAQIDPARQAILDYLGGQGVIAALEDNGYESVSLQVTTRVIPGGSCLDENGNPIPYDPDIHGPPCGEQFDPPQDCDCCDFWEVLVFIYANCCGEIDYEAAPVYEQLDGGGGVCALTQLQTIYPCNPLP